ncbi:MAG: PadR family transcriptional regulator [archaeon]|nr:PadR family transcriptional regulator [archaeon]
MHHFFPRARRLMEKGAFKYLVLQTLKDRPMHGYEIMRAICEKFSGFYTPSAGLVYPTLQMLEDLGYVSVKEESGKKVYSITDKGRDFIVKRKDAIEDIIKKHESFGHERMGLNMELKKLARLIIMNYWDLTPEETEKIEGIIKEAREKIGKILIEGD